MTKYYSFSIFLFSVGVLVSGGAFAEISYAKQYKIAKKLHCQLTAGKTRSVIRKLENYNRKKYTLLQHYYGNLLENGIYIHRNPKRAKKLYLRASNRSFIPATYSYSLLELSNPFSSIEEKRHAMRLLEFAAKSNFSAAQFNLAYRYEHGLEVELDSEKALHWYRQSAYLNDRDSQYKLHTLVKNKIDALAWLMISANNNQPLALQKMEQVVLHHDSQSSLRKSQQRAEKLTEEINRHTTRNTLLLNTVYCG